MKNLIIAVFLILTLIAPVSAKASINVRADDSAENTFNGSLLIKKPNGKWGGKEILTLEFTGFTDGEEEVLPLTLPDNVSGRVEYINGYISSASDTFDRPARFYVQYRETEPTYSESQCDSLTPIYSSFYDLTGEQRRIVEDCDHSWHGLSASAFETYFSISYVKTTGIWENNWTTPVSGGSVENSLVFAKGEDIYITGSSSSELVDVIGFDDSQNIIETTPLKNEYPINTSVSTFYTVSHGFDINGTTYWKVRLVNSDELTITGPITFVLRFYVY